MISTSIYIIYVRFDFNYIDFSVFVNRIKDFGSKSVLMFSYFCKILPIFYMDYVTTCIIKT